MLYDNAFLISGLHNHHYMLRLASPASEWTGCGRRGAPRHAPWWIPGFGGQQGQGWGGPGGHWRKFWRNIMRNQPGNPGTGKMTFTLFSLETLTTLLYADVVRLF